MYAIDVARNDCWISSRNGSTSNKSDGDLLRASVNENCLQIYSNRKMMDSAYAFHDVHYRL